MSDKQMRMFHGMQFVRDNYVESGLSDKAFAEFMSADLSANLGFAPYSYHEVRTYRQSFKIPNNAPRIASEHSNKVSEAKRLLEQLLLYVEDAPSDLRANVNQFLS